MCRVSDVLMEPVGWFSGESKAYREPQANHTKEDLSRIARTRSVGSRTTEVQHINHAERHPLPYVAHPSGRRRSRRCVIHIFLPSHGQQSRTAVGKSHGLRGLSMCTHTHTHSLLTHRYPSLPFRLFAQRPIVARPKTCKLNDIKKQSSPWTSTPRNDVLATETQRERDRRRQEHGDRYSPGRREVVLTPWVVSLGLARKTIQFFLSSFPPPFHHSHPSWKQISGEIGC